MVCALTAAVAACGGAAQTGELGDASTDTSFDGGYPPDCGSAECDDARETGSPPEDAPGVDQGDAPAADAPVETPLETCADGVDNDSNGETDCEDVSCFAACSCHLAETCGNGTDEDCDGLVDCADPACAGSACCADPPEATPEQCSNGIDDDCDGPSDCADSDCGAALCCVHGPSPEDCFNTIDDDCDGAVDCADSDCPWGGCPCTEPSQCPLPPGPCETRTCEDGVCSTELYLGAFLGDEAGNCGYPYCDVDGVNASADDGDAPLSMVCAPVHCVDGATQTYIADAGTPCGQGLACDGQGQCVGCADASSCPAGGLCRTPKCTAGACSFLNRLDGYVLNSQLEGNCRLVVCEAGQAVEVVDDADVPDDALECTWDVCTNGTATNPPRPAGAPCASGVGHVCNGLGTCS